MSSIQDGKRYAHIALLAALPQEYRPFQKLSGPWRSVSARPFRHFIRVHSDRDFMLVETGMGKSRILDALKWVQERYTPDLIVSFGFAGSLHKKLKVGQTFLANRFNLLHDSLHSDRSGSQLILEVPSTLQHFIHENHFALVRILTAQRPEPKAPLLELLREVPSLMDMESYFAAEFALKNSIPFLCFRTVSDGDEDEIDFDLGSITNGDGQVQTLKVLRTVAAKPGLMKSFWFSWRRSRLAAMRIAGLLSSFLSLPLYELTEILSSIQLKEESR